MNKLINNKQDWESIKNNQNYPIELFFQYYLENNGIIQDIEIFSNIFFQGCVNQVVIINNNIYPSNFNYQSAIKKTFEYFENKFKN